MNRSERGWEKSASDCTLSFRRQKRNTKRRRRNYRWASSRHTSFLYAMWCFDFYPYSHHGHNDTLLAIDTYLRNLNDLAYFVPWTHGVEGVVIWGVLLGTVQLWERASQKLNDSSCFSNEVMFSVLMLASTIDTLSYRSCQSDFIETLHNNH